MNGFILFLLLIGVIYIAFTYFKGPRNPESYRDEFHTRTLYGQDPWNGGPAPELPGNDETEMDLDGEDPEEIGFEADEPEEIQSAEPERTHTEGREASKSAGPETQASVPETQASVPETQASVPDTSGFAETHGVVIDSEVRIDAEMPSDTNK